MTKQLHMDDAKPGDTVEFMTGPNAGFRGIVQAETAAGFVVELNEEFHVAAAADLKLTNVA